MKFRHLAGVIVFSVLYLCLSSAYCQQGQPLQIIINSDNEVYVAGEPITIEVLAVNNSRKGIWIARPQEGSEQGFRYPYCIFEVLDEKGMPVQDTSLACKTVEPVFAKDAFVYLKPGRSTDLYKKGYSIDVSKTLSEGTYTVIVSYSTESRKDSQWYGLYSDDVWAERNKNPFWKKRAGQIKRSDKFIRKVPRLSITSNPIIIKVVGVAGIAKEQALRIAQDVCKEQGWEWKGINIVDYGTYWDVNTNWGRLGSNALIRIDKRTGEVLEKHLTGP
jgi:hypothetical protein